MNTVADNKGLPHHLTHPPAGSPQLAAALHSAALHYLKALGWSVIPVDGKRPQGAWGKFARQHPSEHDIARWFDDRARLPTGIGVVCGRVSGIIVVDYDPRSDVDGAGLQWLNQLPKSQSARTGRGDGGLHVYFRLPADAGELSTAGRVAPAPGIEVRGDGHYVVAPPSLHAETRRPYQWLGLQDRLPTLDDVVWAPRWLMDLLRIEAAHSPATELRFDESAPSAPATPGDLTAIWDSWLAETAEHWLGRALERARVGNRNHTGLWLATQLRDDGLPQAKARAVMTEYAARVRDLGDHPYTADEALASLDQAYRRSAREPARGRGTNGVLQHADALSPSAAPAHLPQEPNAAAAKPNWLLQPDAWNPRPRDWLWRNWLERGAVALLCGRPKTGKSLLALGLASIVTRGGPWPDGSELSEPCDVVVWSGETSTDELERRLATANADPRRVTIIGPGADLRADRLDLLRAAIRWSRGSVGLVVLDPLVALLGDRDANASGDVWPLLHRLSRIAEETHAAILLVHHHRKASLERDGVADLDEKALGSTAVSAGVRGLLHVVPVGKATASPLRRLVPGGMNHACGETELSFIVEAQGDTACVKFIGDETRILLEATADPDMRQTRADADWLRRQLQNGPVARKELVERYAGEHSCHKDAAAKRLDRASRWLNVHKKRDGQTAVWELSQPPTTN